MVEILPLENLNKKGFELLVEELYNFLVGVRRGVLGVFLEG